MEGLRRRRVALCKERWEEVCDEVVSQRVEVALAEAEGAVEEIMLLAAGLEEGSFDEGHHDSALKRLRAALGHLESLRPQHPVQTAGAQT